MSYTYGLSIIQSHLIKGARVIATEKTLIDKMFWKLFKEQKATTFGGVPYVYEMLKQLRFERMELPSLRAISHRRAVSCQRIWRLNFQRSAVTRA